jgi:hypothetical protein
MASIYSDRPGIYTVLDRERTIKIIDQENHVRK